MKFYVVALVRGDEFTEGIFDTVKEAIQCADTAWYHLTPQDRKKQTIEVRHKEMVIVAADALR